MRAPLNAGGSTGEAHGADALEGEQHHHTTTAARSAPTLGPEPMTKPGSTGLMAEATW